MDEKAQAAKDDLAGVFNRAAPTYDQVGPRFFSYFGQRLVDLAGLTAGLNVLDVATGRGSVLFPAARQVGPTGHVTGVDLSAGMVRETSLEVARRGLENITLEQMDAENLAFEDNSFEAILCGFGVFFFPQVGQALNEFNRVLKPGGKVAFSVWGASDTRWNWLSEVGLRPRPRPQGNSPVHRHNSDWLKTALAEAGFTISGVETEAKEFFYASEDEWWATEWSHSVRKLLENLGETELAQARQAASAYLQQLKQPEGIPVNFQANFTLAVKP